MTGMRIVAVIDLAYVIRPEWALKSHPTESGLTGRKLSGPAVGDAFIISRQSVWNSRWQGIPLFSRLNECFRLVAAC
jgi:hypothetical protein